jgi:hypothetical protein
MWTTRPRVVMQTLRVGHVVLAEPVCFAAWVLAQMRRSRGDVEDWCCMTCCMAGQSGRVVVVERGRREEAGEEDGTSWNGNRCSTNVTWRDV